MIVIPSAAIAILMLCTPISRAEPTLLKLPTPPCSQSAMEKKAITTASASSGPANDAKWVIPLSRRERKEEMSRQWVCQSPSDRLRTLAYDP